MGFKAWLKDKSALVFLLVIALSLASFVLVLRIDSFVNVDLYSYGLQFSLDWANDYWYFARLLWVFHWGGCFLAVFSLGVYIFRLKDRGSLFIWASILLPVLAFVCQVLSIVFLGVIDNLVYNRLYAFGLDSSYNWDLVYNPVRTPALVLMVFILALLIIPVIRTLKIIKIEIITED